MKKAFILSIAINCLIVIFLIAKRYYYSSGQQPLPMAEIPIYDQNNSIRNSIFSAMTIDTCDIVFVGNSLTEGFLVAEIFGSHVKNRGIGGNRTYHIIQRLNKIINSHPKKIFIEAGVNDLRDEVSPDSVYKNYKKIIEVIRNSSPSTTIYIQSLFPTSKEYSTINKSIVQLNNALADYCTAKGISFIDIYPAFLKNGELNSQFTIDGIHLNGQGYQVWRKAIEKFVISP